MIIEVDRIKKLMGINEFVLTNKFLILEGRGETSRMLWKNLFEIGSEYESRELSQRMVSVRERMLKILEDNSALTKVDRVQKMNKFIKELESSIGTKSIDEIVELLEKEVGTSVVEKIEKKLSDYIGDETKKIIQNALEDEYSDIYKYVQYDIDSEISEFIEKPNFKSLPLSKRVQALNEFTTKLGKVYQEKLGLTETKLIDDISKPVKDTAMKKIQIETVTTNTGEIGIKSIKDQVTDEVYGKIEKEMGSLNYLKATSLEQLTILNNLRKKLRDELKGKFEGEIIADKEVDEYVDEIFDETVKTIKTKYTASFYTNMAVFFKTVPGSIDDLAGMINTWVNGRNFDIDKFTREIDDIIVKIEKGDLSESFYLEIADKIKVIAAQGEAFKKSESKFFEELKTKIKAAFPEDDAKATAIIDKINNENELTEFFTKANQYMDFGTRFKETIAIVKDSVPLVNVGEKLMKILQFSKGSIKRLGTFLIAGTLRTFTEWNQRLAQKRKFMFIGKQIQGYNFNSYLDMYVRVWVTANLIVPIVFNTVTTLLTGALAAVVLYFDPDNSFFQEYKEKNIGRIILENIADDVLDTFSLFTNVFNQINGSANPQDPKTWYSWFLDFFNLIIPFNSKIDDLIALLYNSKELYKSIAEKGKDANKKLDDNLKKAEEEGNKGVRKLKKFKDSEDLLKKKVESEKNKNLLKSGLHVWTTREEINRPDLEETAKKVESLLKSNDTDDVEDFNPYFKLGGQKYYLQRQGNVPPEVYSEDKTVKIDFIKFLNTYKSSIEKQTVKESLYYKNYNLIMENTPRTKFGEDNFKHWKDTFVFKAEDEKNPGQFKQVKINMEDVMDRINHYRKKYDEDDAFVRAVLDTHDSVVKVMYTKDLADISESALPRGLALVLREDRGELEIFSVSRPSNGNWFLVKGDYTPSQLANMDLEKKEPEDKESTKMSKTEDDLKKKEEESIILLKRNEKEGLIDLPRKVKQKLKEKISKGWTTEEPPSYLMDFYTTSQINSVFNDPIEIYKLESSPSYFATLVKYSARVTPKRGFCRSLQMASRGEELNERQRKTVNHILTRCKSKLAGKFGVFNV